ncbi:MAG: amidohydrolase family protein [Planctomycetota bacterium]|nr:amidohydrolase family protein [Planctomycetota bacterium]
MRIPKDIIDVHTHIWSDATGMHVRPGEEEAIIAMSDCYGINAMVVMPLCGSHRPTAEQVRASNDAVASFAEKDRRVRPFGQIDPRHGSVALQEIRRCVEELGLVGFKVWVALADAPDMYPLIERMIHYDRPVLIHAMHKTVGQYPSESDPVNVANLAGRYPEATIIMAHMGGDFIYGCNAIADLPNILTDPSGTYCETGMLEWAVGVLGADRILFGSDAPGADFVNNLAKVMAADITDQDKRKIMYTNAKRLLG